MYVGLRELRGAPFGRVVALLAISLASFLQAQGTNYFPLSVGRSWLYKCTDYNGQEFTNSRKVTGKKEIAGVITYGFYDKIYYRTMYLAVIDNELRLYGVALGKDKPRELTITGPKNYITILFFPFTVGKSIDEGEHTLSNGVSFRIISEIISKEGKDTYKLNLIWNYGGRAFRYRYWMRKDTGIIKVQSLDANDRILFTEELVHE